MEEKTENTGSGSIEGINKEQQQGASKDQLETMTFFTAADPCVPSVSDKADDGIIHGPYCNTRLWNESHRKSLLTSEDMSKFMFDFIVRTKGKNKTANRVDEIKEHVKKQVSGPIVQEYFKEFQKVYDDFGEIALSKCKCARAGEPTSSATFTGPETASFVAPIASASRDMRVEIVNAGPNLSDPESEEEAEIENLKDVGGEETMKKIGGEEIMKNLGLEVSDDEEELDYECDANDCQ